MIALWTNFISFPSSMSILAQSRFNVSPVPTSTNGIHRLAISAQNRTFYFTLKLIIIQSNHNNIKRIKAFSARSLFQTKIKKSNVYLLTWDNAQISPWPLPSSSFLIEFKEVVRICYSHRSEDIMWKWMA